MKVSDDGQRWWARWTTSLGLFSGEDGSNCYDGNEPDEEKEQIAL